jgi:hypothetical protein
MRVEKEGPPLLADGSLDYTESEPSLPCQTHFSNI